VKLRETALGLTFVVMLSGCDGSGRAVSKSEFEQAGLTWPLSVEAGRIGCDYQERWFQSDDGTRYGLNGTANERRGYADVAPVWLDDERESEALRAAGLKGDAAIIKLSIGDMIAEAGKLCSD
jgi:hypothetical protein